MGNATSKNDGLQPIVNISLDAHCIPPFTPGTHISGTAHITGQTSVPLRQAKISLIGRAVSRSTVETTSETNGSKSTSTSYYYHETAIFTRDAILCQQMWIEGQQTNTFRFSLTFPEKLDAVYGFAPFKSKQAWGTRMEKARLVKVQRVDADLVYENTAQPLTMPPMFSYQYGFASKPSLAKVEYGLLVVADIENGARYTSELTPLAFVPPQAEYQIRRIWVQNDRPEIYQSSRLCGVEKSFKNSFKDRFSSHTPSVQVSVGAELPSHIISASGTPRPFNLRAFVKVGSISSQDVDIPSVSIRLKRLELREVTSWRAFSCNRNLEPMKFAAEHEEHKDDKVLFYCPTYSAEAHRQRSSVAHAPDEKRQLTPIPSPEEWIFATIFEAPPPLGNSVSSFRTCNISHRFYFDLSLEADVCGKVFPYSTKVPVVVVSETLTPMQKVG